MIRNLKKDPECSIAYNDRLVIAHKHDRKHEDYFVVAKNKLTLSEYFDIEEHWKYVYAGKSLAAIRNVVKQISKQRYASDDTLKQMQKLDLYKV